VRLEPGPIADLAIEDYQPDPPQAEFGALARELSSALGILDLEAAQHFAGLVDVAVSDYSDHLQEPISEAEMEMSYQLDMPWEPDLSDAIAASEEIDWAILDAFNLIPGEGWEDCPPPYVPPVETGGFSQIPEPPGPEPMEP
jgi:hypothetical protein